MVPEGSCRWLLFGVAARAIAGVLAAGCGGSESATNSTPSALVRNEPAPGLPYLLYTSDRDGDEEIYGVRADGTRTVQITRDELDLFGTYLSPNWRWIYVDRDGGAPVHVSSDGRKTVRMPGECVSYPVFSPDGRLFASGEDTDCIVASGGVRQPLVRMGVSGERPRVLTHGQPVAFSSDETRLLVLDLKVGLWEEEARGLNLVDTTSGRVVGTIDLRKLPGFYDVGLSPSGEWFAYLAGRNLFVVDVTKDPVVSQLVLHDPRLDSESWYDLPVRWLDDESLAVVLAAHDDEYKRELRVLTRDGRETAVVTDLEYDPVWSSDGEHVAYTKRRGESSEVVAMTKTGSDRQVVLQAPYPSFVWTPDDRLLVQHDRSDRRVVTLVGLDGQAEDIFRTHGYVQLGGWSPDGQFLSLGTDLPRIEGSETEEKAIGILSPADRSVVRVPVTGNVEVIGWADSRVGGARAPSATRAVEVAAGDRLRSAGKIMEISASDKRVAVVADESALDCHHVVAWTVGDARVVRFREPTRCGSEGENRFGDERTVAVLLDGTRVTWIGETWGNYAYLTDHTADMARPKAGVRSSGGEQAYDEGVDRPPPERATRRGVSERVENGAVVLVRASDGRTRRISAPGRMVDAELENAGLFYAYNTKGSMPGNVVFIPFAKLFG